MRPAADPPTDEVLMEQVCAGSATAFEALGSWALEGVLAPLEFPRR